MYEGETQTLEARVAYLEEVVGEMRQDRSTARTATMIPPTPDGRPWWEYMRGMFKNDAEYDDAMRLGREESNRLTMEE